MRTTGLSETFLQPLVFLIVAIQEHDDGVGSLQSRSGEDADAGPVRAGCQQL